MLLSMNKTTARVLIPGSPRAPYFSSWFAVVWRGARLGVAAGGISVAAEIVGVPKVIVLFLVTAVLKIVAMYSIRCGLFVASAKTLNFRF